MHEAPHSTQAGDPLPRTAALFRVARRLVWWEPPEEALADRTRFLGQVMTLGTWQDIQAVGAELGADSFRAVLENPPPGVFDQRSWHYWHHVFGLWQVPDLPRRRIP